MWWFGQYNANKGAWDVDIRGRSENKSRRGGLKILLRGMICLLAFLGAVYAFHRLAEYFEGNTIVHTILYILSFGLPILALSTLQIPFGLYYFIRYFKIKD